MGRIKTKQIKRITNELIEKYGNLVATTFNENKKVVSDKIDAPSKKLRNMITGYATRCKIKLNEKM